MSRDIVGAGWCYYVG